MRPEASDQAGPRLPPKNGALPRAPKLKGYSRFPVAVVCIARLGKTVKSDACATAYDGETLDSLSWLCLQQSSGEDIDSFESFPFLREGAEGLGSLLNKNMKEEAI